MERLPPQVDRVMKGVLVGSALVLVSDIVLGLLLWPFGRWPFPSLAIAFFAVSLLALSGILLAGRRYPRLDGFLETHSYVATYFVAAPVFTVMLFLVSPEVFLASPELFVLGPVVAGFVVIGLWVVTTVRDYLNS